LCGRDEVDGGKEGVGRLLLEREGGGVDVVVDMKLVAFILGELQRLPSGSRLLPREGSGETGRQRQAVRGLIDPLLRSSHLLISNNLSFFGLFLVLYSDLSHNLSLHLDLFDLLLPGHLPLSLQPLPRKGSSDKGFVLLCLSLKYSLSPRLDDDWRRGGTGGC
jgi:hypothetical protein